MILTPTEPTLILSDLHLGHRASLIRSPEQLEPILKTARTAIFNGDTAEMRNAVDRPVGRRLAAELGRICHNLNTKAIFLNGNHDPTISHLNHLDLHSGAILVTHGDILFRGVAPWSRDAKLYAEAHRQVLDELGPEALQDFEERLYATKEASLRLQMLEKPLTQGGMPTFRLFINQLWPPTRPFVILHAWWVTPNLAANLASVFRPQAQFIVIGHTHRPGLWRRSSRVIVNSGSFISRLGATALLIDESHLEVRKVDFTCGRFALGRLLGSYQVRPSYAFH